MRPRAMLTLQRVRIAVREIWPCTLIFASIVGPKAKTEVPNQTRLKSASTCSMREARHSVAATPAPMASGDSDGTRLRSIALRWGGACSYFITDS